MFLTQIIICYAIFFIAIFGILFNLRNILIVLVCVELMLLSVGFANIMFSLYLDDMIGQLFAIFILTIAAAESAVGLGIFIQYFRIRGNISLYNMSVLRG
jgi:NADH-quinone oxidoreductase subunit K